MRITSHSWISRLLMGLMTVAVPAAAAGQPRPPIHNVTGVIAPQPSVDTFYSDVNKLARATRDGVDRLRTDEHPTADVRAASLTDLRPGKPVVVDYTIKGVQTSAGANAAVVTAVRPHDRKITVRFTNGSSETLRLAHHVSATADPAAHRTVVVVSYAKDDGRPVARYFTPHR
jgi:hypothetical protein